MTESSGDSSTIDRRRFLKRAGTVAWTTPFILSVMQESAFATSHCLLAGATCGSGGQCSTAGFLPCCSSLGLTCKKSGPSCLCSA